MIGRELRKGREWRHLKYEGGRDGEREGRRN